MPSTPGAERPVRTYTRRRLTLLSYQRGFRGRKLIWRGVWYGLLVVRAIRWLRPSPVLVAREVLHPGETVTIFQTTETVGKRRR